MKEGLEEDGCHWLEGRAQGHTGFQIVVKLVWSSIFILSSIIYVSKNGWPTTLLPFLEHDLQRGQGLETSQQSRLNFSLIVLKSLLLYVVFLVKSV